MLKDKINGSEEPSKQNRFSLISDNDEFILILSKNKENIDFKLHSLTYPELKYQSNFNFEKLHNETQIFKITNDINEGYNLISECINSKLYSLKDEIDGKIFSILSMLPGIKNVDFLLNKNFSAEEEIFYQQNNEQEKYIKSLREEINQLKEINSKNEKEILELKKIIEDDNKKQDELNEKILNKLDEENNKTQKIIETIISKNENSENSNIFSYITTIMKTFKQFSIQNKFLYWESKENWNFTK